MKRILKFAIIVVSFLLFASITLFLLSKTIQPKNPQVQAARDQQEIDDIIFYGTFKQVLAVSSATISLLSALMLAYAISRAIIKKNSVHTYKIGKYNEIIVHDNSLDIAAPVAMGLVNAQQLRETNGGLEKAVELYSVIAEAQTKQIKALTRGTLRTISSDVPMLAAPKEEQQQEQDFLCPSFQELLNRGEIAPGKPMILGYENGIPRRGSFLDIYSAAVAGESGSGKTATLLFLLGCGVIAENVRFMGIDPHYPHPKSLGFKTKALWEAGLMKMATSNCFAKEVLQEIESTIDRRLSQEDKDTFPVVLVIDELAFLNKTSIGPAIAHTMERISTEGRKCAVYMLASSQTWLVARTGESSVVRDTLTSAFVHRIKPKQANLLLQDKEQADKVKHHCKKPGEALLVPVGDDSTLVKIPFTDETDMNFVVQLMDGKRFFKPEPKPAPKPELPEGLTIREIERATRIPYSALQRYYSKGKELKPEYQEKLTQYILTDSALKSLESNIESQGNHTGLIQ